jgi:hypothetical protein
VVVKSSRKLRSVILISLGVFLAICVSAMLYLNVHLEEVLKEQINLHTPKDIEIDFKAISINTLTQSARIDQIEVSKYDSEFIDWSASIDKLFIKELSVITLLKGDGLKLDSIVISGLDIDVHQISQREAHQNSETPKKRPKSKLPLQVDGIRISSGSFHYDPEGPSLASGSFSFSLGNFQHDSLARIDLNTQFLNSQFNIRLDKMVSEDSLYVARIQSIQKTLGDTVFIDSLSLLPTQSLVAFTKFYGWNKGMLGAEVPEIKIKIDLSSYPDFIGIPFCSVRESKIRINKDNRWPLPNRTTLMPQVMLSGLPIKFRLDSLSLTNAEIKIDLIQENGKEASLNIGNVFANLSVQNLNDSEPAFELSASQILMGEASAYISTTYHYGDNSPFEYSLEMENSKLDFMSDFLQKAIGIEIKEGQLNRLTLNMTGNNYSCRGEVLFEYSNLAIAAVNKETGKEKKMLNALANILGSLVFWKDNPSHDKYRTGTFSVERDVRKAFTAQWFEGLQAGIINVVAKIDPLKVGHKKSEKNSRKKTSK